MLRELQSDEMPVRNLAKAERLMAEWDRLKT
eukprot:CAMPEP_0184489198 /NCGR_PEP_ID=MMETSP0113_2-20130426/14772_1 /TAXON_ID=91329 /ORGANISM="Norrisiella sphaerica, Strain BC52" /LENGTH=30 /DNA_ID= /DNA_START= /DNA_END= /DNA_ORIENTATION=